MEQTKIYSDFKANENQPLQPQLTAFFRSLLTSGRLKVGDRILPLHQLAEVFGTNYFSVNAALKPLVEENLLERKPRIGTFVRHVTVQPTSVGIYNKVSAEETELDSTFNQCLISSLSERLGTKNIAYKLFTDFRPLSETRDPMPELQNAVESGEIQQVLVLQSIYHAFSWLSTLGVPIVAQAYHPEVASVITDLPEVIAAGVSQLKKRGCRKVAVICSMTSSPLKPWNKSVPSMFKDECRKQGLEFDPSHLVFPYDSVPHSRASFGYHMFNMLWDMKARPDGLFLHPDSLSPGVINAISSLGVRVPEQLKIVMTKNCEPPLFLPFPVDVLEFSVEKLADQIIERLYAAVRGDDVSQAHWSFKVRENVSSLSFNHSKTEIAS